ncbi:related to NTG1-DNA repair protein [Sporisorium reilianum f. sp. reilianum]|uniref:Endonuclease III homolog n=1 Tax=Sporisorium reilianum f. sp. reilianum TaxID=72559 RepID=A0A2N8UI43_9BASI|nr:related to NTG1-DNA repair protein [Sporisorium reilianum f. sp. reilianum]
MSSTSAPRSSSRRKLFAPTPVASDSTVTATTVAPVTLSNGSNSNSEPNALDNDAALAAALSASEARRSYSLRRRAPAASTSSTAMTPVKVHKRTIKTSAKRVRAQSSASSAASDDDSAAGSDFSDAAAGSSDHDSDVFSAAPSLKPKASTKRTRKSAAVKRDSSSDIDVKATPRKATKKPIKVNLEPHEAHPAPEHWERVYTLLAHQRRKIVAPVDTMGCEENGRQDRRADAWRATETPEDAAKRERLATLVSLMLSSQTKDPVTAEAVYNLQRTLPGGLCLASLLAASDETISQCIAKVGFWRRKTGYLKSAARILASDFGGDVPRTVDELCSLPGVGPKMAFLALSSMGIQVGIGVDTHVHRLTNRLGWHTTRTPEQTRLNLQSWLPAELHGEINRLLVGFGQVICVPVGPRCDLCSVAAAGLCPSARVVDEKSAAKRVKVEMLASDDEDVRVEDRWVKVKREAEASVKVEMDAPMHVADLTRAVRVKKEQLDDDAAIVDKALEW